MPMYKAASSYLLSDDGAVCRPVAKCGKAVTSL
jgi:hypothetical protein